MTRNRWFVVLGVFAGVVVIGLVIVGIVLLLNDNDDENGETFEATMDTAEDDLDAFWGEQMEERDFASRYESPEIEYYDEEVEQTDCGETVPNNAFYCPADNTIYLHRTFLENAFDETGAFAPVFVLAHEWGHSVQHDLQIIAEPPFPTEAELQAECLAGVYTNDFGGRDDSGEDLLAVGVAFIESGDPGGSPWWDEAAHGSIAERTEAYTLGYEEGLDACFTSPLPSPGVLPDSEADGEPSPTATETEEATDEGGGESDAVETVSISDNQFEPRELEVEAGTTVEWEWGGSNPHSVVGTSVNSGFLDSGVMTGSGTYEATFDEPGTYEYQCGIHGTAMSARVIVN